MNLTRINDALWLLSLTGQICLFAILVQRRIYRSFPVFTIYIAYSSISDALNFLLFRHVSETAYFHFYFANSIPEFLCQIAILLEVARNVVEPVRRSLPKPSLVVLGVMILTGSAAALILSIHSTSAAFTFWWRIFVQVNFAVAILRLVIFSAITFFSQMLGIGWKNHVLQIATGFATYSIVVLLVELLHHFSPASDNFHYQLYEQFRIVGWCGALGYWSYVLAKKEAPRKEFSPKMANFLVSVAEVAKNNRASVARWHRK